MKELTLDLHSFVASLGLSAIASLEVQKTATEESIIRCKMSVCGENQKPYTYDIPASWWDHFKRDCFPKWLLKRFPAKTISKTIDIKTIYPFLASKIPKELRGPQFTLLVADKPCAVWTEEPISIHEKREELFAQPMFDMHAKRCMTCGTSFDKLFNNH